MMLRAAVLSTLLLAATGQAQAAGFEVTALGARGGIQDGNLSAYLIRPQDDPRAVTCDAGALVNGLVAAEALDHLDWVQPPADSPLSRVGHALVHGIRGYLISHAHLDHVMGLVAASPDDGKKPIYGLASVNAAIERSILNWEAWPNFGDRGKAPQLKKYAYRDLAPATPTPLDGTAMTVSAYPLSHGGVESTAFMIESGRDAILCFGDTGPDAVEGSGRIAAVWEAAAPLLAAGRLKAIIIEVSYPNAQPDRQLYGHLTPNWLMRSLHDLDRLAPGRLEGLPVIVSHIKYSLAKGPPMQEQIARELAAGNDLGLRFIVPEQGMRWRF